MEKLKRSSFVTLICSALFTLVVVTGCDIASDSSTTKQVSVNMQVATGTSSALNKASVNTTQASDSVSLDNIKLLVRKLELEGEGEYHNESDDSTEIQDEEGEHEDDDEGEEFELRNQIFDLPLDGSKVSVSTQEVPSGSYDNVELKIGPAEAGSGLEDPDLIEGDADSLHYSMAISGTYGDSAFTFKSHKYFKIEMEIDPPVEVTDSTASVDIDLQIDPSGWFKDPETGDYLNPADPANQGVIEANIARSFKAECHRDDEDGDHHDNGDDSGDDGHDDDNGED